MENDIFEQLYLKKKQQYLKLIEVSDFTDKLAEAVDTGDEVSVKITLSMRQEPLVMLQELQDWIRETVEHQPEETAIRLAEILSGGEGETESEKRLAEQVAQNRRILTRVQELDKRISMKLDPKRSFYNTFR